MRRLRDGLTIFGAFSMLAACGGGGDTGTGGHGGGTGGDGGSPAMCTDGGVGGTGVAHVIIVIQENHTFDTYFGRWCKAAAGSNPTCTDGPACCEAAPDKEPSGASPVTLDDAENGVFSPDHSKACEDAEMNGGAMDRYVTGATGCSNPENFAIATDAAAKVYHDLATQYAVADRYFQPISGQSSSNDMYFAVAKEVFIDNASLPPTVASQCSLTPTAPAFTGQITIADLLQQAGKTVTWYAEGYADGVKAGSGCAKAPADCAFQIGTYPCIYDPGDVPFLYYDQYAKDEAKFMRDYSDLAKDLAAGTLPDVSFVKAVGYHTEHPGLGVTIAAGTKFVSTLVDDVQKSCFKDRTLILVTWDEGGGYYDHVKPPADSTVDSQNYGTRVPLLAIGRYAKKGTVSHVTMEHSSIVKFLEWNYLGGMTGQLNARDKVVNNIGSLLDPAATGVTIPDM
jgi:phospholipase C